MQVLEVSRLAQRPYSLSLSLSVLLRKTDNDNSNESIPEFHDLQEVHAMLSETVKAWSKSQPKNTKPPASPKQLSPATNKPAKLPSKAQFPSHSNVAGLNNNRLSEKQVLPQCHICVIL